MLLVRPRGIRKGLPMCKGLRPHVPFIAGILIRKEMSLSCKANAGQRATSPYIGQYTANRGRNYYCPLYTCDRTWSSCMHRHTYRYVHVGFTARELLRLERNMSAASLNGDRLAWQRAIEAAEERAEAAEERAEDAQRTASAMLSEAEMAESEIVQLRRLVASGVEERERMRTELDARTRTALQPAVHGTEVAALRWELERVEAQRHEERAAEEAAGQRLWQALQQRGSGGGGGGGRGGGGGSAAAAELGWLRERLREAEAQLDHAAAAVAAATATATALLVQLGKESRARQAATHAAHASEARAAQVEQRLAGSEQLERDWRLRMAGRQAGMAEQVEEQAARRDLEARHGAAFDRSEQVFGGGLGGQRPTAHFGRW